MAAVMLRQKRSGDVDGLSGLALLAESPIAIHTWPESTARAGLPGAGRGTPATGQKLTSFKRETPLAMADCDRLPA